MWKWQRITGGLATALDDLRTELGSEDQRYFLKLRAVIAIDIPKQTAPGTSIKAASMLSGMAK